LKHTLKIAKKCWDSADEYHCLREWFDGFEKELRELDISDWLDKNHPDKQKWCVYGANFLTVLEKFVEEILGKD
jgi:hypothetical protein